MLTVSIREAKKQLAQLVDLAAKGKPFVITKGGKPLVKVVAIDASSVPRRLGFMDGEIAVPDDFDRMGEKEIGAMFGTAK